jgi:hypothetical protein
MTRKDFQLIAEALQRTSITRPMCGGGITAVSASEYREHVIAALADALATTNPRFNRDRFIGVATGARKR